MWSAASLPLTLGGAIPAAAAAAAAGPRYHLMAVGRHEGGEGEATSSAQKQVTKQQQLSGSDVLIALQRAAEKKKTTKNKKYFKDNKARGNINIDDAGAVRAKESFSHSSAAAIVNVKPICINPQWAHQLHQLETTLHQLTHASLTS